MTRFLVVASLVLIVGCGGTPVDPDGGAGGGGASGGGGGHTGGGGGALGGGAGGAAGGGTATECTSGDTRPCCTTGVQTCSAAGFWLSCSVAGTPEVCNGVDDDCDGQVDEDVTFTPGELADAGAEADAGCTVGVGACARTAGVVCSAQGAATCGATAGTPGAETCNGIDDDCDGDVDEGVLMACLDDDDGDRYATDTTTGSMVCPDATRVDFGNCPVGFVSSSASLGVDCAHGDATRYVTTSVRTDADSDGACVGTASDVCAGSTLPAGVRAAGSCALLVDCDDTNASKSVLLPLRVDQDGDSACVGPTTNTCTSPSPPAGFRLAVSCVGADDCDDADATKSAVLQVRADADGDGYCTGAVAGLCAGGSAPSGYRTAASCNATDDCDDADAAKFVARTVRADADNDGYCVGAATTQCQGASMVPGSRETISCASSDDCNDTSATLYRTATLRADQDNDGYCAPGTVSLCIGTATPTGYRVPAQCNAVDDCKDSNPNATTTCVVSVNSTQFAKSCGIGPPPTESGTVTLTCPFNFYSAAPLTVHGTNAAISCSAGSFFVGQTVVSMSATCATAYIGTGACYVSAQCFAN